jgi:hypothetical protein
MEVDGETRMMMMMNVYEVVIRGIFGGSMMMVERE